MTFFTPAEFGPECSLGYLARRVHQIGQSLIEPIFVDEGLSATQWSALMSLLAGRSATCADLARDLSYDKGASTRLVDAMEQHGWVTRSRANDDRRVLNLELTPEGEAIAIRCRDRIVAYWNVLLAQGWSADEIETLIGLLKKLRTTLDDALTEGRRP
ncbi:MarR family winged helix-turn-helix transcriptional regulator [Sphingomonas sp. M1A8_2b]